MPTAFISYSPDSEKHRERVLALAAQLRNDGIDVRLDQYSPHPPEGWPAWARKQVTEVDFVLMICTSSYLQYRESPEPGNDAVTRTIRWEAILTENLLYETGARNEHIIPILFEGSTERDIPLIFRAFTYYRLPSDYGDLYRRITNQPFQSPPPLGKIRLIPAASPSGFLASALIEDPHATLVQQLEPLWWHRVRLGMAHAELPGTIIEPPANTNAPLLKTSTIRSKLPTSESYFMLQEDRLTIPLEKPFAAEEALDGAQRGALAELGTTGTGPLNLVSSRTTVDGYPARKLFIEQSNCKICVTLVAVHEVHYWALYAAVVATIPERLDIAKQFLTTLRIKGPPPQPWRWKRLDLGRASIEWPTEPKTETSQSDSTQHVTLRVIRMTSETPHAIFALEELSQIQGTPFLSSAQWLNHARDTRLRHLRGTVELERIVHYGDYPGRQLEAQIHNPSNNRAGIRLFTSENAVYTAIVIFDSTLDTATEEANRFLESFRPAMIQ